MTVNFGLFYSNDFQLNGLTEHRPFAALGYALSAANFIVVSGNFRFFGVTVSQLTGSKIRPAAIHTRKQKPPDLIRSFPEVHLFTFLD